MDARRESEPTPMKNRTTVERKSERALVVTRTFNGKSERIPEDGFWRSSATSKTTALPRWFVSCP